MIRHIAGGRLPPRENRVPPRVVKKRMSNFAKTRPDDRYSPRPQISFEPGVVILGRTVLGLDRHVYDRLASDSTRVAADADSCELGDEAG